MNTQPLTQAAARAGLEALLHAVKQHDMTLEEAFDATVDAFTEADLPTIIDAMQAGKECVAFLHIPHDDE